MIKEGAIYQHYKGKQYRVQKIVRHSESLEEMVMYEALYPNELGTFWVRPKSMWSEEIRLPNGNLVPRFALIE